MSRLEDDISRVMAGHDDEAPGAADLLRALERAAPPRRRPGWYVPFMVAAAVIAVVAGSAWAGGLLGGHQRAPATTQGRPVPAGSLSCPASYAHQAPWVPANPAGVDGRSRLVPQYTPTSALICAYRGSNTARQQAGWALSGQRPLAAASPPWPASSPGSRAAPLSRSPARPWAGRRPTTSSASPTLAVRGSGRRHRRSQRVRQHLQRRVHQLRHCRPRREQGVRLRPVARPVAGFVQAALPGHRPARPGHGDGPPGATSVTICAPKARTVPPATRAWSRPSTGCPRGPRPTAAQARPALPRPTSFSSPIPKARPSWSPSTRLSPGHRQ